MAHFPQPHRSVVRVNHSPGYGVGETIGPASSPEEPLLMETGKPLLLTNQGREPVARGPMKSLIGWGMHYIRAGDGLEELYSLSSDPEERNNVANLPKNEGTMVRFRNSLSSMLEKH